MSSGSGTGTPVSSISYATAAELRAYIGKSATDKDAILTEILAAAEDVVNEHCNRPDGFLAGAAATARIFAGSGMSYQLIDECVEITQVAVKESASDTTYTAWLATDWIAFNGDPNIPNFNELPYNALMVDPAGDFAVFLSGRYSGRQGFRPHGDYRRSVPTVQVTARWGYAATVPPQVKSACLAQSARWWKRFQGSFDDTIVSSELGAMTFKLRGVGIDQDIALMLERLIAPSAGALR